MWSLGNVTRKYQQKDAKNLIRFLTNPYASAPEQGSWRFNLRESNTEPLLRLNVETIGDENLLIEQTMKISEALENVGGKRETKFRF